MDESKFLDCKKSINLLRNYLEEHFEFKDKREKEVVLCWILGTYYRGFYAYPRLILHGTKRAGKSKLLTFLSLTCRDAVYGIIPSVAAIFRVIEELKPTLIMDEFNLFSIKDNPELAAILHAGYKPSGEVLRVEKNKNGYALCRFPVFCPIALAGLTINDDQLLDRSITINMVRSTNEKIISNRIDDIWFDKNKLLRWKTITDKIKSVEHPDLQQCMNVIEEKQFLSGRDEELWLPILSVAKLLKDKYDIPVWDDVFDYCKVSLLAKTKEDLGSFDIKLIAKMKYLDSLSDFRANELANLFNQDITNVRESVSTNSVGHALKRLGIEFKNHSGIRHYYISLEDYQKMRKKYGIEDD